MSRGAGRGGPRGLAPPRLWGRGGALPGPREPAGRSRGPSPPHLADGRVMSSSEAKLIYEKYDEMIGLLRAYREKTYQQWVAGVDQDCHFNLGQPLIQRDPVTSLIRVNFSKEVGAVPPRGAEGVRVRGPAGTRAPRQVGVGGAPRPWVPPSPGPFSGSTDLWRLRPGTYLAEVLFLKDQSVSGTHLRYETG